MGMDSPEIGPAHVADALSRARRGASAYICPATDGGYTLLALPPAAPNKVFQGVEWSTERTCLSQANAIAKCGIPVLVGPVFDDIDEVGDLMGLRDRLLGATTPEAAAAAAAGCPRVTACLKKHLPEGCGGGKGAGAGVRGAVSEVAQPSGDASRAWLVASFVAGSAAMWVLQQAVARSRRS